MKKIYIVLCLMSSFLFAERPFEQPPQPQDPKPSYILAEGTHYILGMSPDGVIELENECQFKTADGYAFALRYWDLKDRVTFVPNNSFFGGSQFYIVNYTKNETVKADIWRGPNLDNVCTDRLLKVDEFREEIVLSNSYGVKTRWKIETDDFRELLEYWKIGASVIIGKNNRGVISKLFSASPYILSSYRAMRHNLYVRATQIPL